MQNIRLATKTAILIGLFLSVSMGILGSLFFLTQREFVDEVRGKLRQESISATQELQKEEIQGLKTDIGILAAVIAQGVGRDVYDINPEGLEPLLRAFMDHEDLTAIAITEEGGEPFAAIWRSDEGISFSMALPDDFQGEEGLSQTLGVSYFEQPLGDATVYYTNKNILARSKAIERNRLRELEEYNHFLDAHLSRSISDQILRYGLAIILLVAVIVALIKAMVQRPLQSVVDNLCEIAQGEGDLSQTLKIRSNDEIGILSGAFNRFVARLRDMVRSSHEVTGELAEAGSRIQTISGSVNQGVVDQSASLQESHIALQEIEKASSGITSSTGKLLNSTEESSAAVLELGATIEEIATQMEHLFATVESVSSSINEMSVASQQIFENVEVLSSSTEVTASAITELDASIKEIEENADRTNLLSAEAADDALKGKETVEATLNGISSIRKAVDLAAEAIRDLGGRSKEIGKILSVIDEVADQTGLLALNAAIIAAQAGEHGKGFAVVADEIRELAERTAVSTREISGIISALQEGTDKAVRAMEQGSRQVHQEAERSKSAGAALEKIHNSTLHAKDQVAGIVRATQEQSRGSRQITNSINQVASMLEQITAAFRQQNEGVRMLAQASESLREIAAQGKLSTSEQAKGTRQIGISMEDIRSMTEQINAMTHEQSAQIHQAVAAISRVRQVADRTAGSTNDLDQVVEALTRQTAALKNEIGAFKID